MTDNRSARHERSHDAAGIAWDEARSVAHAAGGALPLAPTELGLYDADCDGRVLAEDIVALTDVPAFASSLVDGYAVRGPGPWHVVGTVLAGTVSAPIGRDGGAVRISTGAMVPADTEAIVRVEETESLSGDRIDGRPRARREWRAQGEQARRGALLVPEGATVTPAVLGVAASVGYDRLRVRPRPRLALVLLGDEVATAGVPGDGGRLRDAIGPQLPAWARRLGFEVSCVLGPVPDDAAALRTALRQAARTGADMIATAGGTMNGPTDFLRPTLAEFGAEFLVPAVRSRPGRPMLLARLRAGALDGPPDGDGRHDEGRHDDDRSVLLLGMPGRPQPALLTLLTLAIPAAAGMTGRALPPLPGITLGAPVPGRRGQTRLVLVHLDGEGRAFPVQEDQVDRADQADQADQADRADQGRPASSDAAGSAWGMAGAMGFAVIAPGAVAAAGELVPLLALPLKPGEQQTGLG